MNRSQGRWYDKPERSAAELTPADLTWRDVAAALWEHSSGRGFSTALLRPETGVILWPQVLALVEACLCYEEEGEPLPNFLPLPIVEVVSELATGRRRDGSEVPKERWAEYLANPEEAIRLAAQGAMSRGAQQEARGRVSR